MAATGLEIRLGSQAGHARALRVASMALAPAGVLWDAKEIVAQILTGFTASFLAFLQVPQLEMWLPDPRVRSAALVSVSMLLAFLSALPALAERRSMARLRARLRTCYSGYITRALDDRLDRMLENLGQQFPLGQLTASIMVPTGRYMLVRARQLHIIAASRRLRSLPSMALRLDWDEGLAGRIWKEGPNAAALALRNDPDSFAALKLNRIDPRKRRDGSFGHEAGICLPINSSSPSRTSVTFLGVLSIGSDRAEDLPVFQSREFQAAVYTAISEQIAADVDALRLADGSRDPSSL